MTLAPTLPIDRPAAGGAQRRPHRSVTRRAEAGIGPVVAAGIEPEPDPEQGGNCLICSGAAAQPDGCCSAACAHLAHVELQAASRRLQARAAEAGEAGDGAGGGEGLRALAERAGRLSSALLRWRAASEPVRCPGLATPLRHRSVPGAVSPR